MIHKLDQQEHSVTTIRTYNWCTHFGVNGQFFYFYFINIIIQQTVEFRRIELVFTKL